MNKTLATNLIIGLVITGIVGVFVYNQKQAKLNPTDVTNEQREQPTLDETLETVPVTEVETSEAPEETTEAVTAPTLDPAPTPVAEQPKTTPVVAEEIIESEPVAPAVSGITLSTIAMHSSRSSCWSAINGNVYDLTSWIPNHPGGEKNILRLCGIDGTATFTAQHGSKSKILKILAGYKIDVLAK